MLPEPRQETNEDTGEIETAGKIWYSQISQIAKESENLDFYVLSPDFQITVIKLDFFYKCYVSLTIIFMNRI